MKKEIGRFERMYPNPAVLVSCSDGIRDNIITIAWAGTVCSNPPMISVSIRPSRYSHELIIASKEFVINIPESKLIAACEHCGTISGRECDKFKENKLSRQTGSFLKTPMIKECPISIECSVKKIINLGSHDMFIGEVLAVHADESIIYSDGDIDYEKIDMLSHLMGYYFKNKIIK